LFREFVIAKHQRDDEIDRDIVMAWQTAALIRSQKLPDLKKLLAQRKRKIVKQTRLEQQAAFHMIAAGMQKTPKKVRFVKATTNG
jgi:hypothetical protein